MVLLISPSYFQSPQQLQPLHDDVGYSTLCGSNSCLYISKKKKISKTTLIITIAAAGIIFISFDSEGEGSLFGLINGLLSSLGFCWIYCFSKMEKKNSKIYDGSYRRNFLCCCSYFSLLFNDSNIFISLKNSSLSALHGFLVLHRINFIFYEI